MCTDLSDLFLQMDTIIINCECVKRNNNVWFWRNSYWNYVKNGNGWKWLGNYLANSNANVLYSNEIHNNLQNENHVKPKNSDFNYIICIS